MSVDHEATALPRPLLEARGLVRSFPTPEGALTILAGIDLVLVPGELVALIGVSGSGKSTLIQILGGLDHPSAGTVRIEGRDLFALPEKERAAWRNRHFGFIYQAHRLLPEFSALENVMMPLLIGRQRVQEARQRARRMLEEVGLGHRMGHRPGALSGGEQQRVAIARAMVTEPLLLLADEPTGNLDEHTAGEVFELIRRLNREHGLTCLMVTHHGGLARRMDRCLQMKEGRLMQVT
ncbi:MAG: ABC transporter ATP-binding protein [Magnetococcus sp. WYHC-3]